MGCQKWTDGWRSCWQIPSSGLCPRSAPAAHRQQVSFNLASLLEENKHSNLMSLISREEADAKSMVSWAGVANAPLCLGDVGPWLVLTSLCLQSPEVTSGLWRCSAWSPPVCDLSATLTLSLATVSSGHVLVSLVGGHWPTGVRGGRASRQPSVPLPRKQESHEKTVTQPVYNQPPALLPPGVWCKLMVSFLISSELTINNTTPPPSAEPHTLQISICFDGFVGYCSSNETQIPEKENLLSSLSQRKNHNESYKTLKPEW